MVKVFTMKISEELISEIEEMAKLLGITKNSLATLLMNHGIVHVKTEIMKGKKISFKAEVSETENKLNDIIHALNDESKQQEISELKEKISTNKNKSSGPKIGICANCGRHPCKCE